MEQCYDCTPPSTARHVPGTQPLAQPKDTATGREETGGPNIDEHTTRREGAEWAEGVAGGGSGVPATTCPCCKKCKVRIKNRKQKNRESRVGATNCSQAGRPRSTETPARLALPAGAAFSSLKVVLCGFGPVAFYSAVTGRKQPSSSNVTLQRPLLPHSVFPPPARES